MNLTGTLLLIFAIIVGTILLTWRRSHFLGATLIACVIGSASFLLWQSYHRGVAFEAIPLGASEQEVVVALGSPPRITDGTEGVEEGFLKDRSQLISGCVKEYWYAAFLVPQRYSFCFDAEAKLIHKYNWVSW